jgi:hypothetical protein
VSGRTWGPFNPAVAARDRRADLLEPGVAVGQVVAGNLGVAGELRLVHLDLFGTSSHSLANMSTLFTIVQKLPQNISTQSHYGPERSRHIVKMFYNMP